MNVNIFNVIFIVFLLLGCSNHQKQLSNYHHNTLENFNRSMFNFNYNFLDYYIIYPTAILWRDYIPKAAHNGLNNFFSNLEEPSTTVNYLIEGKFYKAIIHFNRFFLNTFLGMGGIIDIASMANPKLAKESSKHFGSTIGFYGVHYGPYIHLPIYGSFTPREDLGNLIDDFYPVLSYLTWWMFIVKWIIEGLEQRTQVLYFDAILKNSVDPYIIIRDIYFQQHNFIANNCLQIQQHNLNTIDFQKELESIDS